MRKTAVDYRKELSDLTKKQAALNSRIMNRAHELVKAYPNAKMGERKTNIPNADTTITAEQYASDGIMYVSDALYIIETIEAWLAEKEIYTQGELFETPTVEHKIIELENHQLIDYKTRGRWLTLTPPDEFGEASTMSIVDGLNHYLSQGMKLMAVKFYKFRTGKSLRESKDDVDRYEFFHHPQTLKSRSIDLYNELKTKYSL